MAVEPGSTEHLSQVISHVVAPSFLLGAVAGFISILATRLTTILDRLRALNAAPDEGHPLSRVKADIPRLKRRAKLVNTTIYLSILSGIVASILIIVAFAMAYLGYQHVWGAAILFIVALGFLCAALVVFAEEVRISLTDYDHH
jgi:Protein of unknown function (DUF2721)